MAKAPCLGAHEIFYRLCPINIQSIQKPQMPRAHELG